MLASFFPLFAIRSDPQRRSLTSKQLREPVQLRLSIPELLQSGDCRNDIVAVGARLAMALPYVMQLLLQRQPSGVLRVAAVHNVAEPWDPLCGLTAEPDRPNDLPINGCYLLAIAQISNDIGPSFTVTR